ncbi:MAG: ABC transporter permease [Myxococcales bacterium]
MGSLGQLTAARLRIFAREPSAVFWTFGFPLLLTIALGIAFQRQGPPKLAVAVTADSGPLPALGPRFELRQLERGEADLALRRGQVALVVSRPPGGALTYRFDPTRPEGAAARLAVDDALQRAAGRADPLPTSDDRVDAPGSRYMDWLVPGLLGMQLMSGSLWGVAYAIVETRQRKLLKRLSATPMRRRDYLASFILSRLIFVIVETPIILWFAKLTFGVAIHAPMLEILAVSCLGAASFAGLALLCASRAQNTETANGLVNLATLPMVILCGVFFSASRFPAALQLPIRLLPLAALNDSLRALVNDGASLHALWSPLAVLCAWGVASFALALRLFRWT